MTSTLPTDANRAYRVGRALELYRQINHAYEPNIEGLIAQLLADLTHFAAGHSVNYGALIAHAQATWLKIAPPRPPPKRES